MVIKVELYKCYLDVDGIDRVHVHRAGTIFLYPLVSDSRISWFVNDYDGKNTIGLGAYWGYLMGALDRRNVAMLHHAPLDETSRSDTESVTTAASTTTSTILTESESENDEENASKSNRANGNGTSQSSIFTFMTSFSENSPPSRQKVSNSLNGQQMPPSSNGQQMTPNSMPNTDLQPVRVSVIVPAIVQPPIQPVPVLQPADDGLPMNWADDPIGKSEKMFFQKKFFYGFFKKNFYRSMGWRDAS